MKYVDHLTTAYLDFKMRYPGPIVDLIVQFLVYVWFHETSSIIHTRFHYTLPEPCSRWDLPELTFSCFALFLAHVPFQEISLFYILSSLRPFPKDMEGYVRLFDLPGFW